MGFKIERVREIVSDIHSKFIEQFGCSSDIVVADRKLKLTYVYARMTAIFQCLVHEGVISDWQTKIHGETYKFVLSKEGIVSHVLVLVCCEGIVICADDPLRIHDGGAQLRVIIREKEEFKDGYNWDFVTRKLMNFIHSEMYKGSMSAEYRLFGSEKQDKE